MPNMESHVQSRTAEMSAGSSKVVANINLYLMLKYQLTELKEPFLINELINKLHIMHGSISKSDEDWMMEVSWGGGEQSRFQGVFPWHLLEAKGKALGARLGVGKGVEFEDSWCRCGMTSLPMTH